MEAWSSNNDPKLSGGYLVEALRDAGGLPERVRSDGGTENGYVQQIQCLLRQDHEDKYAGNQSFLYGRSTTNQPIESWWGILRRQCVQHWMDLFKQLQHDGFYSGDFLVKNIVRFCFMDAIQKEIKDVVSVWNNRRIRASKQSDSPTGKPSVLYDLPKLCGGEDRLNPYDDHALDVCEAECRKRDGVLCDEIVFQICTLIMEDLQWNFPEEPCHLVDLYLALQHEIKKEL